jgi:hypothetical protein
MKKNILMFALCLTSLTHGHQIRNILDFDQNNDWPLDSEQQKDLYVLVKGEKQFVNHLIGISAFSRILAAHDLKAFQKVEALFAKDGLCIFRIRMWDWSLLSRTISFHYESEDSNAFFDYILSHATAEEINEIMVDNGWWRTSTVEIAALSSPYCLTKILNHPAFNPALFLNPQPLNICNHYGKKFSSTPQDCIDRLRNNGGREKSNTLITILQEKFNL